MFKNMKLSAKMLFGAKELSSPSDSSFNVTNFQGGATKCLKT